MENIDKSAEDLAQFATDLERRETAIASLENDFVRRESVVTEREQKVNADRQMLELKKADLARREQAVIIAEQVRDAGFADERTALNAELRDKRSRGEQDFMESREKEFSDLEDEIAKLRAKRLEDVTKAERAERDRIGAEVVKERAAWGKQQDDARKQWDAECTELEKQKGALLAMQREIEGRKVEYETAERTLERKEKRMEQQWQKRQQQLDDEVEHRLEEARNSLASQRKSWAEENARLRDSLAIQTGLLGAFEQLKRQLGGKDPVEILRDLNSQTDELKRLREDLATRPTEEMRERYRALESKEKNQKAHVDELKRQIDANETAVAEVNDLRRKNAEFGAENKSLVQRATLFEGAANEAQAELNRLRAAYERPAEVDARRREIEVPHFKADSVKQPVRSDIDEMTWLTGIGNACNSYGLQFSPRILKAFHTALKTAEWSPVTVLAGVSGTGKSELPRLYSHFGGIFFEPISVQPNWDSQESMLGFFNSIDNKFDAQPLLRFLAQSQKPWLARTDENEGYPGLSDGMCLVLLDELNLAHPELYFAEFLSKLESRRGKKGADVPFLPVKIGAGLLPYQLPLGRNLLWAGTMNQDETTKSLSDKVIDRSIIINFPRPTELKRRLKLSPLDDKNRGPALHKAAWQSWLAQDSKFSDEEVKPFKEFIEKINSALSVSGRALGHRVWQSIEYYMANYPDVRAAQKTSNQDEFAKAMHIAFEDQIVQKVMPKLRGLDTRGKSRTDCLDKIGRQLVAGIGGRGFNLTEDFDLACELGYGQFIWQSANYINATDTTTVATIPAESEKASPDDGEEPPMLFQKEQQDHEKRRKAWNAKLPKDRNELRVKLEANHKAGRIPGASA